MSKATRTALILGATGGIGGETAHALARHGRKIRALSRNGKPSGNPTSWDWVKGDSLDQASITTAADGADAIVHAVNPPGYKNWAKLVLPMIENTISAARASGARKAVGKASMPVKALPWFIFKLASPFNETPRELYATRPLWQVPIQLDNTKLVRFLGKEPHTPLQTAVEATLRGIGCLA